MGDPTEDRGICREQGRAVSLRHAVPALIAITLVVVVVSAGSAQARAIADASITRLGSALNDAKNPLFEQKNQGSELQRAAFEQADLLVAYGASELLDSGELYHARLLLRDEAVGFDLFPVAREGAPILSNLQRISSVGNEIRGKKVVISISPGLFLDPMSSPSYYAGSYSTLQAAELIFSSDIGLDVRRGAVTLQATKTLRAALLFGWAVRAF